MRQSQDLRRIVVVGHVDHGKSTLLARIMLDLGCIPEDKITRVKSYCDTRGSVFEPAFLLDAFLEEQEQGVSIETTQIKFQVQGHQYLLIDAPGHLEFLRNMTTGASGADTALLVVDCQQGVRSQTERHLRVLEILGVNNVVVALNKMDEMQYKQQAFEAASHAVREILVTSDNLSCQAIVPVSAFYGENISRQSWKLGWYAGKPLLETLISVTEKNRLSQVNNEQSFRMLLQDVYRFENKRHFVGRIVSGQLKPGAHILFSPSGKISSVESIEKYPHKVDSAVAGESVALELDEQVYVERGEIISFPDDAPEIDNEIRGRAVWLSSEPFLLGGQYIVKIGTTETKATVHLLTGTGNLEDPALAKPIVNGAFVDLLIQSSTPLAFDRGMNISETRSFVLCSENSTVAAGTIDNRVRVPIHKAHRNRNVTAEGGYIGRQEYELTNGHRGVVLWLTGLPGAGKSSLAKALEHELFKNNYRVVALDADNVRSGLSDDLGFTAKDRAENIRRIGHVAKLFLDTGSIVVVACVSPASQDRETVRSIVGAEDFKEIYVHCPIDTCQDRDPKGLYNQASKGKIKSMTGLSSSYQPPRNPALKLDTDNMNIEQEVQAVLQLLKTSNIIITPKAMPVTSKS